jgi:hypothetical protein
MFATNLLSIRDLFGVTLQKILSYCHDFIKNNIPMKQIIFIISLCGAFVHLNAQPNKIIFLKTGEAIDYTKFKNRTNNLEYKNQTGIKQMLNYRDIHFIIKRKEVLVPSALKNDMFYLKDGPLTVDRSVIDPQSSCTKAMIDAISNTDFRGAKIGGFATGLLVPIGLVGTAVIASTPPAESKLNCPENINREDNLYIESYIKTVKKQKSKQTWFAASLGSSLAVLICSAVIAGTL